MSKSPTAKRKTRERIAAEKARKLKRSIERGVRRSEFYAAKRMGLGSLPSLDDRPFGSLL